VSLQSVEAKAVEAREVKAAADAALHAECKAALTAGGPLAAVARAAGVTRATVRAWPSS
jgi:hypothetical protein